MYFQWAQLIHALFQIWKNKIKQNLTKNESNLLVPNHHLIKKCLNRNIRQTYGEGNIFNLDFVIQKNPTLQSYFEKLFPNYTFDWKQIYFLPLIITTNTYQCNFQYKILYNILYLNKKMYIFGKIDSPLCSICHSNNDTLANLFCECVRVSQLWSQLRTFFSTDLNLPLLTPQIAIFDFLVETDTCIFKITNHLLLIFKMYTYKSREKGFVDISSLINEIIKIKTLEKNIATNNDTKKLVIYNKRWEKTHKAIKI